MAAGKVRASEAEGVAGPVCTGSVVAGVFPAAGFIYFARFDRGAGFDCCARFVHFAAADFLLPVARLLLHFPSGGPCGWARVEEMVVRPVFDGRDAWTGELRGADENEDGRDEHERGEEKSETARRGAKANHVLSLLSHNNFGPAWEVRIRAVVRGRNSDCDRDLE